MGVINQENMLIYIAVKISVSVQFSLGLILWLNDGPKASMSLLFRAAFQGLSSNITKSIHGLRWLLAAIQAKHLLVYIGRDRWSLLSTITLKSFAKL